VLNPPPVFGACGNAGRIKLRCVTATRSPSRRWPERWRGRLVRVYGNSTVVMTQVFSNTNSNVPLALRRLHLT